MINIGFVNLILIIANNAFGSREPSNPCFSASVAPSSLCFSTSVVLEGIKLGTVTSDIGKKLTQ